MKENKETKTREQIEKKYKWNIEAMYEDEAIWEEDCQKAMDLAEAYPAKYQGRLGESGEILLMALKDKDHMWRILEKAYVYARMKRDEDNRVSKYQSMCDKTQSLIASVAAHLSFFTPEILGINEEKLMFHISSTPGLEVYGHLIEDTLRQKAHVLTPDEERLMAQFRELGSTTNDIFSMINNADMKFGTIEDEDGDQVEVTHGRYIGFLESENIKVRQQAYEQMYGAYEKLKNTLATNYHYNTKHDVVVSRIRRYDSSLKASLSGDNVSQKVYDNLINIVNDNLHLLHRYVDIRRKALNLKEIHMYDMYAPLVAGQREKISYEDALDMVKKGLSPLGEDYIHRMVKGIESRWMDVFENQGKTSGAYSFGCYDSMPYILLNYNGRLKDVFTIAHEMGHSMHSLYSREEQPYIYGGHSIFTAEVASTVNENLLMRYLLDNEDDVNRKKYLTNLYIEDFRGTVFRQTMFAEFEKNTHEAVENGEMLTAQWLCDTYDALNRKYFGDNVSYDPQIAMEWARIPHFYNGFYVYKYATGFSAAVAIADRILHEGKTAGEDYIRFLKSGEKDYPIELLKIAGVDMGSPEPIRKAMKVFEALVDEMEQLIAK